MSLPHSKPRTLSGWQRRLARLPIQLYRLRLGWLLGRRFLLINHIGRKSGKPRQVVVEVVRRDAAAGTWTVPSGLGPTADWYRNLRRTPEVTIQSGLREYPVLARFLSAAEGGSIMVDYAAAHPRTSRMLMGVMGFPVDGSEASYREVGESIPFVRFERTSR